MKRLNTLLCCALMVAYGAFVGVKNIPTQTITAATVDLNNIPYDLRPVIRPAPIHDTVFVDKPVTVTKYKYRTKTVKVPYRDTTDIVIRFTFDCAPLTEQTDSVK